MTQPSKWYTEGSASCADCSITPSTDGSVQMRNIIPHPNAETVRFVCAIFLPKLFQKPSSSGCQHFTVKPLPGSALVGESGGEYTQERSCQRRDSSSSTSTFTPLL